jgi:hypothetical protein
MKFVMYRDEDFSEMDRGYHVYSQGVIGISTVKDEEKLIIAMKEWEEDEEGGYHGELERTEFEIGEEGFIILPGG